MKLSFFFNDTATTEIYTLSLHDALPISDADALGDASAAARALVGRGLRDRFDGQALHLEPVAVAGDAGGADRKSTRLNSSHANISYAVFCLKKKINLLSATQRGQIETSL